MTQEERDAEAKKLLAEAGYGPDNPLQARDPLQHQREPQEDRRRDPEHVEAGAGRRCDAEEPGMEGLSRYPRATSSTTSRARPGSATISIPSTFLEQLTQSTPVRRTTPATTTRRSTTICVKAPVTPRSGERMKVLAGRPRRSSSTTADDSDLPLHQPSISSRPRLQAGLQQSAGLPSRPATCRSLNSRESFRDGAPCRRPPSAGNRGRRPGAEAPKPGKARSMLQLRPQDGWSARSRRSSSSSPSASS